MAENSSLSHTYPVGETAHIFGARSLQPAECGLEVSGGRGSPKPNKHQLGEVLCLYSPCASYMVFFFPSRLIYRSRKMREMQGCSFHLWYLKATPLVNQHTEKP